MLRLRQRSAATVCDSTRIRDNKKLTRSASISMPTSPLTMDRCSNPAIARGPPPCRPAWMQCRRSLQQPHGHHRPATHSPPPRYTPPQHDVVLGWRDHHHPRYASDPRGDRGHQHTRWQENDRRAHSRQRSRQARVVPRHATRNRNRRGRDARPLRLGEGLNAARRALEQPLNITGESSKAAQRITESAGHRRCVLKTRNAVT